MTIGKKIQEKRREKKLTPSQLANKIGVTLKEVVKWEKEEAYPNKYQLVEISNALDVSIDYFIPPKRIKINKQTIWLGIVWTVMIISIIGVFLVNGQIRDDNPTRTQSILAFTFMGVGIVAFVVASALTICFNIRKNTK